MNWKMVIIALEEEAAKTQDIANMLAIDEYEYYKLKSLHYDAIASLLRSLSTALNHGVDLT